MFNARDAISPHVISCIAKSGSGRVAMEGALGRGPVQAGKAGVGGATMYALSIDSGVVLSVLLMSVLLSLQNTSLDNHSLGLTVVFWPLHSLDFGSNRCE